MSTLLRSRAALFALKVVGAGLLLALALGLINEALTLEWSCSDGGPHSWLMFAAGLSSAAAFLILFSSRTYWWIYAILGGLVGYAPMVLVMVMAIGRCAN
jgi:hypothetical protein